MDEKMLRTILSENNENLFKRFDELHKEIQDVKVELRGKFSKALQDLRIELLNTIQETKEELRGEFSKALQDLRIELLEKIQETKEELEKEIIQSNLDMLSSFSMVDKNNTKKLIEKDGKYEEKFEILFRKQEINDQMWVVSKKENNKKFKSYDFRISELEKKVNSK